MSELVYDLEVAFVLLVIAALFFAAATIFLAYALPSHTARMHKKVNGWLQNDRVLGSISAHYRFLEKKLKDFSRTIHLPRMPRRK